MLNQMSDVNESGDNQPQQQSQSDYSACDTCPNNVDNVACLGGSQPAFCPSKRDLVGAQLEALKRPS